VVGGEGAVAFAGGQGGGGVGEQAGGPGGVLAAGGEVDALVADVADLAVAEREQQRGQQAEQGGDAAGGGAGSRGGLRRGRAARGRRGARGGRCSPRGSRCRRAAGSGGRGRRGCRGWWRGEGGPALVVGQGPAAGEGVVDVELEQGGGVVAQAAVEVGEAEVAAQDGAEEGRVGDLEGRAVVEVDRQAAARAVADLERADLGGALLAGPCPGGQAADAAVVAELQRGAASQVGDEGAGGGLLVVVEDERAEVARSR
jgi:hypothetical protein